MTTALTTPGYTALREAAAIVDLDVRGRFRALGEDRARLLHAMTTNHVQQMQPGATAYAFFLNAQGRILGDVWILCAADHFLLDTEPGTHEELFQHLDRYIIADDVTLADARQDTACIGVEGPVAPALLDSLPAAARSAATVTGAPGGRLFVPAAEKQAWLDRLAAAGAAPATPADAEVVRLENHRPRFGADFLARHLVQETQLLHAVHFAKGCYLGQEIVERVRSRGNVHRLLVPVTIEAATPPAPGSVLLSGAEKAGELMSAAFSPALGKVAAFAFVRADRAQPGTELSCDGLTVTVAAAKGR